MKELIDIHKRMVRNVFLNAELLLNEGEKEIFEYDIQAFMYLFFRNYLKPFNFKAGREKHQKVDCVIYADDSPVVFYEIKTYFKDRETIKTKDFINDISKIASLLKANNGSKGYFFTIGMTKKYESKAALKMSFIKSHLENDRKWQEVETNNDFTVRVRPSVKETKGISNAISWEIRL